MTGENFNSSEEIPFNNARSTAKLIIDGWMREEMRPAFSKYRELLLASDSSELNRYSSMIEWGARLMGEDVLLDTFSISRDRLRAWISGQRKDLPGPLARSACIDLLIKLVDQTTV